MNKSVDNESNGRNGEDYECYICHHKLLVERSLPFAGKIICPRCLRKLLLPILLILVGIILIIILLAIF